MARLGFINRCDRFGEAAPALRHARVEFGVELGEQRNVLAQLGGIRAQGCRAELGRLDLQRRQPLHLAEQFGPFGCNRAEASGDAVASSAASA